MKIQYQQYCFVLVWIANLELVTSWSPTPFRAQKKIHARPLRMSEKSETEDWRDFRAKLIAREKGIVFPLRVSAR